MINENITISDAEWLIMKALWHDDKAKEEGFSLKEINEAVSAEGWGYTTVRTMVGRLVEKGALRADKSHRGSFLYYPAVSEEKCAKAEVRSLVDRIFDGSARLMVSSLVEDKNLTEEEQRTLLAIIEKME